MGGQSIVKLAGKKVAVVLTEDGRQVIRLASVGLPDSSLLLVVVYETDELGIWIRVRRGSEERFFLLRWEYVLGIEAPDETGKSSFGVAR